MGFYSYTPSILPRAVKIAKTSSVFWCKFSSPVPRRGDKGNGKRGLDGAERTG